MLKGVYNVSPDRVGHSSKDDRNSAAGLINRYGRYLSGKGSQYSGVPVYGCKNRCPILLRAPVGVTLKELGIRELVENGLFDAGNGIVQDGIWLRVDDGDPRMIARLIATGDHEPKGCDC